MFRLLTTKRFLGQEGHRTGQGVLSYFYVQILKLLILLYINNLERMSTMVQKLDLCKIFGVEEGQLFNFSGTTYVVENNKLLRFNGATFEFQESSMPLNYVNEISSEEIQYLANLNPNEQEVLRNLPEEINWLARDNNGDLYVFEAEPHKNKGLRKWVNTAARNENKVYDFTVFNHLFRFVQYDDLTPFPITKYLISTNKQRRQ